VPIDSQLEVSVGLTQAILETLRTLKVADPESLLQAAGIDPGQLAKPENRIPLGQQQMLWQLATQHSDTTAFGLQFARCIQPTSFGVLGYMAMNCHTIDECFDAVVKYQFLAGQGGEFTLERDSGRVCLCYTPVNPEHPATAQRVVAMLAANVSFGRWLVGEDFRVARVEFCQQAPAGPAEREEYAEFFACPVEFGATHNRLVYNATVLQLTVPNASEELLQLLQERANRLLEGVSQGSGIAARITSLLATQLTNRVPDKARIAAQIGMSERTLQRRLREEGTSFQEILDNTRHYLARELLRNTSLALNEVAMQLGFSEPSAFFRAFKKWEGCTPGQYRTA
jgi:AraC-like DNA-binding protein